MSRLTPEEKMFNRLSDVSGIILTSGNDKEGKVAMYDRAIRHLEYDKKILEAK